MPGLTTIPPFPDDVPTHPLLVIDYQLILADDQAEVDKLWKAATELGFWYLKNHGVDEEVNAMFDVGEETLALPLEEKLPFEQGDQGFSFGYKAAGVYLTDESGTRDVTQFLNISKDDALAWPVPTRRTYPHTVNARMESAVKPFVEKSMRINHHLIDVLNDRLGLPKGVLAEFHQAGMHSGCTARVIHTPPFVDDDEKIFLTAHTDFGSLTFLHNRLGGLQVLPPGSDKWFYVRPLPGHAICNIGDALNIFSGGILRSSIHRVVPPPKAQARYERWSLVYFTRPNDMVELRAQADKSAMIAAAVAKASPGKYEPGVLAKDWLARRVRSQRVSQYKGAESWKARMGTEDTLIPNQGRI
ncbi:Clavaminate synthase-like protein [Daedaleopsis nitida]|nr:Clavaminate synthase-like protein [Daedaleopsis nitida]